MAQERSEDHQNQQHRGEPLPGEDDRIDEQPRDAKTEDAVNAPDEAPALARFSLWQFTRATMWRELFAWVAGSRAAPDAGPDHAPASHAQSDATPAPSPADGSPADGSTHPVTGDAQPQDEVVATAFPATGS